MTELLTEQYSEAYSTEVSMERENGTTPLYPPFVIDWLVFPIHRRTQKVWKDRDKGLLDNSSRRWIWKPFQNYKIWSGADSSTSLKYYDKSHGQPPVNHYINKSKLPTAYCGYWWHSPLGGPNEPFGEAGKLNSGAPLFLVPSDKGGFIAPPAELETLQQRALASMLPSIKSELSALNSIYELKDFAFLLSIRKRIGNVKGLISFISQHVKSGGDKSLPLNLLTKASSSFLLWKFAVAPLISDVAAIHAAISTYKRRINDAVSRTGGRQTRHFTVRFNEFPPDTFEDIETGFIQPFIGLNGCTTYRAQRRIRYEQSTFHAQVQYNYNYTDYQRQHAATLGLLDALGVNLNPAIIWNAIPFSFVVDWVLKVGDALETFKVDNMEPQINIHQYLWSIKRKRSIEVKIGVSTNIVQPVSHADRSLVSLPLVHEEAYGRFTDYPVSSSQVLASGLSSGELVLGAALVTAISGRKRSAR